MKSCWRKLSAFLVIVLIIGTMAVPTMAATTTVNGGTTKATATELKCGTKEYICNLKSSTNVAYFKFKTPNYYAWYNISFYDGTFSKNIKVIFKRANDSTIEQTDGFKDSAFTSFRNLQPNTWYYIMLKNPNHVSGKITIHIPCYRDEDRNTKATAKVLTNAITYNATLCPGICDVDYYKFVPTQTGQYRIIVRANDEIGGWEVFYTSFLRQDGSLVVKKTLKKNGQALITDRTLTRGRTYYIRVSGQSDNFFMGDEGKGRYKVRICKR